MVVRAHSFHTFFIPPFYKLPLYQVYLLLRCKVLPVPRFPYLRTSVSFDLHSRVFVVQE